MHHFVLPAQFIRGNTVAFPPAQAHQITRVLRLRDGDEVVVLDGVGAQYHTCLRVNGKDVCGEITGLADTCHEPERRVTLLVAPPKGERWEWLLQKGTEIGVARFIPLVARYSRPGTAVKPRHHEIVREAVEQCRRLLIPAIDEPQPFAQALTNLAEDSDAATILLWEGASAPSLSAAIRPAIDKSIADLCLIIGPEGGFHLDEVALARARGIPIAGLGPTILRTETAGLVAATIALTMDGAD